MVLVTLKKENDLIKQISLKGHAGYDVSGKDIVCSSISSITITTVNGIISIYGEGSVVTKYESDCLIIDFLEHNNIIDKLIDNMINLLKELEEQYKKYIKVEQEV